MRHVGKMFLFALLLAGVAFAAAGAEVTNAVSDLCNGVKSIAPPASMLMTVSGALVYAVGQLLGAETRARAVVWATNLVTGGVVSVLIVSIAPPVVSAVYPDAVDCGACLSVGNEVACDVEHRCCSGLACVGGRCTCSGEGARCGGENPSCCAGQQLQCETPDGQQEDICVLHVEQGCGNDNGRCANGQVCRTNACRERGAEGEACDNGDDGDCVALLVCNEGVCAQPGIAHGTACNAHEDNACRDYPDYVCRPEGNGHTCQQLGAENERCDAGDVDCANGLTCQGAEGSETCQRGCAEENEECRMGANNNVHCCGNGDGAVCRNVTVNGRMCTYTKGNTIGAGCDSVEVNADCGVLGGTQLACGSRYLTSDGNSIQREVCCKGNDVSCSAGAGSNPECCTYQNSRQVCRTVAGTRKCTGTSYQIGDSCDDATDCRYAYFDCYAGACCTRIDNTCGVRNDYCCNQASNSCIGGACKAKRGEGETCDENDNTDCQAGLACQNTVDGWKCQGQQGNRNLGEACANRDECSQDLGALYCAVPGGAVIMNVCCRSVVENLVSQRCAMSSDCCSGICALEGLNPTCVGRANGQPCTIPQQCESNSCLGPEGNKQCGNNA